MANQTAHHDGHPHIVPIRTYTAVLIALLALMAATVAISFWKIPSFLFFSGTMMNQLAALLIAVIKATLVVAFFMGVKYSTQLTKFWALLGFTWLTFFTIMAGDYGARNMESVQGWEAHGDSALPRTITQNDTPVPAPMNDVNVRPRQ